METKGFIDLTQSLLNWTQSDYKGGCELIGGSFLQKTSVAQGYIQFQENDPFETLIEHNLFVIEKNRIYRLIIIASYLIETKNNNPVISGAKLTISVSIPFGYFTKQNNNFTELTLKDLLYNNPNYNITLTEKTEYDVWVQNISLLINNGIFVEKAPFMLLSNIDACPWCHTLPIIDIGQFSILSVIPFKYYSRIYCDNEKCLVKPGININLPTYITTQEVIMAWNKQLQ